MGAQPKSHDLTASIARTLEAEIVIGHIRPLERLIEEDIAGRFQVKRHVARQALIDLEAAGILQRQPAKGVVVREYSPQEIDRLYQVRELVESQAAALIELPISPDDYDAIETICLEHAEAVKAFDLSNAADANMRFHREIYRLCGNEFLSKIINDLAHRANIARYLMNSDTDYLKRATDEHFVILKALKGNDNAELARLCVKHMQTARIRCRMRRTNAPRIDKMELQRPNH